MDGKGIEGVFMSSEGPVDPTSPSAEPPCISARSKTRSVSFDIPDNREVIFYSNEPKSVGLAAVFRKTWQKRKLNLGKIKWRKEEKEKETLKVRDLDNQPEGVHQRMRAETADRPKTTQSHSGESYEPIWEVDGLCYSTLEDDSIFDSLVLRLSDSTDSLKSLSITTASSDASSVLKSVAKVEEWRRRQTRVNSDKCVDPLKLSPTIKRSLGAKIRRPFQVLKRLMYKEDVGRGRIKSKNEHVNEVNETSLQPQEFECDSSGFGRHNFSRRRLNTFRSLDNINHPNSDFDSRCSQNSRQRLGYKNRDRRFNSPGTASRISNSTSESKTKIAGKRCMSSNDFVRDSMSSDSPIARCEKCDSISSVSSTGGKGMHLIHSSSFSCSEDSGTLTIRKIEENSGGIMKKMNKFQTKVGLFKALSDFGPLPSSPAPPKPPRVSTLAEKQKNNFKRFSLVDTDCSYLSSGRVQRPGSEDGSLNYSLILDSTRPSEDSSEGEPVISPACHKRTSISRIGNSGSPNIVESPGMVRRSSLSIRRTDATLGSGVPSSWGDFTSLNSTVDRRGINGSSRSVESSSLSYWASDEFASPEYVTSKTALYHSLEEYFADTEDEVRV